MSEQQYEGSYGRLRIVVTIVHGGSDDGGEEADVDEVKEVVDELKQRMDKIVTELCEVRVQVHKLQITTICVGVCFGCVTIAICGVAIGSAMSRFNW
jgi:hypothetical protein